MPHDSPPWATYYQQWARLRDAHVFEGLTDDLRQVLRLNEARPAEPSAVIFDSRTLQSTPESGPRAGYDGANQRVVGFITDIKYGQEAEPSPDLEQLLGRRPAGLHAGLKELYQL